MSRNTVAKATRAGLTVYIRQPLIEFSAASSDNHLFKNRHKHFPAGKFAQSVGLITNRHPKWESPLDDKINELSEVDKNDCTKTVVYSQLSSTSFSLFFSEGQTRSYGAVTVYNTKETNTNSSDGEGKRSHIERIVLTCPLEPFRSSTVIVSEPISTILPKRKPCSLSGTQTGLSLFILPVATRSRWTAKRSSCGFRRCFFRPPVNFASHGVGVTSGKSWCGGGWEAIAFLGGGGTRDDWAGISATDFIDASFISHSVSKKPRKSSETSSP